MNEAFEICVCPYCDQRIEYPAHGRGEKVSCPGCQRQITLAFNRKVFTIAFKLCILGMLFGIAASILILYSSPQLKSARSDTVAARIQAEAHSKSADNFELLATQADAQNDLIYKAELANQDAYMDQIMGAFSMVEPYTAVQRGDQETSILNAQLKYLQQRKLDWPTTQAGITSFRLEKTAEKAGINRFVRPFSRSWGDNSICAGD